MRVPLARIALGILLGIAAWQLPWAKIVRFCEYALPCTGPNPVNAGEMEAWHAWPDGAHPTPLSQGQWHDWVDKYKAEHQ